MGTDLYFLIDKHTKYKNYAIYGLCSKLLNFKRQLKYHGLKMIFALNLMIYLKMANRFTNCFNFKRQIFILFFILTAAKCSFAGVDTLTVMYYNILNYHIDKLLYYRTIIGYSKPDVILLNEVVSDTAPIAMLTLLMSQAFATMLKRGLPMVQTRTICCFIILTNWCLH